MPGTRWGHAYDWPSRLRPGSEGVQSPTTQSMPRALRRRFSVAVQRISRRRRPLFTCTVGQHRAGLFRGDCGGVGLARGNGGESWLLGTDETMRTPAVTRTFRGQDVHATEPTVDQHGPQDPGAHEPNADRAGNPRRIPPASVTARIRLDRRLRRGRSGHAVAVLWQQRRHALGWRRLSRGACLDLTQIGRAHV